MAKIGKDKEVLLPVALLKELLRYEYETGLFYWLVALGRGIKVGQAAGNVNADGYVRIQINGHSYKAHRLAWAYVYGDYPDGKQSLIDHINGKRDDNRIVNLKISSTGENQRNMKMTTRNTSGITGVYRQKSVNPSGKIHYYWIAQWYDENGKQRHKLFSIGKLGEDRAKRLAIAYRVEQIRLLEENHNIIYSERHGA